MNIRLNEMSERRTLDTHFIFIQQLVQEDKSNTRGNLFKSESIVEKSVATYRFLPFYPSLLRCWKSCSAILKTSEKQFGRDRKNCFKR